MCLILHRKMGLLEPCKHIGPIQGNEVWFQIIILELSSKSIFNLVLIGYDIALL